MTKENEVIKIFKKSKALLSGHFLLSSGLHSPVYFEKFQVLKNPVYIQKLCKKLAQLFKKDKVQVVIGPATGGILLAYEVAKNLKTNFVFAETENNQRVLKRGFEIKPNQRVLLVDDVLTTGGSVREVIDLVERCQGKIIGIGFILDRSGGKISFSPKANQTMFKSDKYPLKALATVEALTYHPSDCPLCRKKLPLVKPGSREVK